MRQGARAGQGRRRGDAVAQLRHRRALDRRRNRANVVQVPPLVLIVQQ